MPGSVVLLEQADENRGQDKIEDDRSDGDQARPNVPQDRMFGRLKHLLVDPPSRAATGTAIAPPTATRAIGQPIQACSYHASFGFGEFGSEGGVLIFCERAEVLASNSAETVPLATSERSVCPPSED
jgi:hypothetical protein